MIKKYNITESKVFCMAPWVHVFNSPSGDVQPCCVSLNGSVGNLYESSIEEIWNNTAYKNFRKELLSDTPSKHCERCYKEEAWGNTGTLRQQFNTDYADCYTDLVENFTDPDGTLHKMLLLRWDFRFNNLCNLACLGCSPEYSSTWGSLNKVLDPNYTEIQFKDSKKNKERFINVIKTQANYVKKVYFAGGEPLIQSEHYEILEEIKNLNRLQNIDFTYSTNLNTMSYKSTNIIDYWKDMKKLRVLVSIDEVDEHRLYYMRFPSMLNKIIENIKLLNTNLTASGQDWTITPTWSIMNMHRMKEIVGFFYDNNLLPRTFYNSNIWEYDVHNIILMGPERLAISGAPLEWKQIIHKKLDEYKIWYINVLIPLKEQPYREHAVSIINSTIERFHNSVNESNNTTIADRKNWFDKMDNARSTNFNKTFPELHNILGFTE